MILTRDHTDAVLCGCAAMLLAIFAPAPMSAPHASVPPAATAPDNSANNKTQAKTADPQPNNNVNLAATR